MSIPFLFALVGTAAATSNFPSALESDLAMPCRPACTVCHTTNSGGSGTVTRDFGVAMMDRGLTASNTTRLQDALTQMESDAVDSDGDGTIDTVALSDGLDPNDGSAICGAVLPEYGCFGGGTVATIGLWFLPALALRRRSGKAVSR